MQADGVNDLLDAAEVELGGGGEGDGVDRVVETLEDGQRPVTVIWQVPAVFRGDRAFGIVCEILQDAERYAGQDLNVIAVCL